MNIEFRHEVLSRKALRSLFWRSFISKKKVLILFFMVIFLFLVLGQTFEMYDLYSVKPYLVLVLVLVGLLIGGWRKYNQWASSFCQQERDKEYIINNKGVGYNTSGLNYFLEWSAVDLVRDTESLIMIGNNNRAEIIICKFAIKKEILQSINEILKNAPLKGKDQER